MVASAVALIVFAAAGALAWRALLPAPSPPVGSGEEGPPVTVTVRSSDPGYPDYPSATLTFGAESQEGQFWSFGWDGAIIDTSTPVLTSFIQAPRSAQLVIEGDADSVTAYLGSTSYPFEKQIPLDLSAEPVVLDASAGDYALVLKATWPQGVVPFAFGIAIREEQPTESPETTESAEPQLEAADVSLFAFGERSEEMPVAVSQFGEKTAPACTEEFEWTLPNGTKLRAASGWDRSDVMLECDPRDAVRVPAGTPIRVIAASATNMRATRTVAPLYPGPEAVMIEAEWPDGDAIFRVQLDVVVTDASPTDVKLGCAAAGQVKFPAPEGPRVLPAGAAYIVGNLPGARLGDVVEQMTRRHGGGVSGLEGTWQIVQNGVVIARVEYPELNGVACRGSGMAGV
jgi:hypothetical protein